MPINDDKQINIKSLEIQCHFLIKELQPCVKKQLYREVITKCEKLINKNYRQLSQICASIMLKMLLLQSKAVLKLLQKNVYKKYLYQQNIIKKLLRILNRNNTIFNAILVTKIKSKQILQQDLAKLNSYDGQVACNQFRNQISIKDFDIITKKFSQIYLSSVLYQLANFRIYKLSVQKCKGFTQYFDTLTQSMPNFSFRTQFSIISIKLALCKILFEKNNYFTCMKLINQVVQKILNLHFKIRLWYKNKQQLQLSSNQRQKVLRKNKHYMKKVMKLLITSIIMMIRINMLNDFQDLAIQGIKIFNLINQKSNIQMGQFRKYLNPQMYIYQQFCQYRAQKFQIQQIIQPLFANKIQELRTNFNTVKQIQLLYQGRKKNSDIVNFYNEKMIQFGDKLQYNVKKQKIKRTANKKLLQQNQLSQQPCVTYQQQNKLTRKVRQNSIKSKHSTRTKHPLASSVHTQILSVTHQNNVQNLINDVDFLNMQQSIIDDIEQTNRAYLTSRKQSNKNSQRNLQQKNQYLKNDTIKIQDKQVINNQLQLDSRLIEKNQKSLKVAQKLIGNFFNKPEKFNIINSKGQKQIVKNKKLVRSALVKKDNKQKSINIQAQNQKMNQIKQQLFKDLKNNIQLLKQKKNNTSSLISKHFEPQNNLYDPKNSTIEISEFIDQKYQPLNGITGKQLSLHSAQKRTSHLVKNSQTMNLNSKFKQKLKHLNRKTKLKMFIQLLTKNKQYFGVKKWSQKIQYIKKKQQLKEKLRSTRKTTSINVNAFRGLGPKLNFIAGNVFMYSLQDIEQLNSSQKLQKRMTGSLNVSNQNNYKLGMKSIQILMNKLQKEKQSFTQHKQKQLLQRTNRLTKTQRNSLDKNKNKNKSGYNNSVSKLNSSNNNKNSWLCKFVL